MPTFAMAIEVKLNSTVPMYDQAEFNKNIPVYGDGDQDCVPTAIGMVFGYYYKKNGYNLIPNPNNVSGDLSAWTVNSVGIKKLIEYSACEVNNNCQGGDSSLSKWVNYSYGQLGYTGTSSGDLCHKARQAFADYDSNFSLTVSYDEINTNIKNKDEIVARIKEQIDNGNPVMFLAVSGMRFRNIGANDPTPSYAPNTIATPLDAGTKGHAMVITAYNGNIFRLNFGYGSPQEVIIDADANFGYTSTQGTCAQVYFFTPGENIGVGLASGNVWTYGNAGESQQFVNAYVKYNEENIIGDVSVVSPYVYGIGGMTNLMYVQQFEDYYSIETYIVSAERNNWYYTYPITGPILTYWLNHYSSIGHPEGMPFWAHTSNGTSIYVQKFVYDNVYSIKYIGTESGNNNVSEYNYSDISEFPPAPSTILPTFGDVEFLYGNAYAYGYGPANGAIYQEDPCPTCPDLWKLHVTYWGAMIGCAETPKGLPIKEIMVEFRAKVENGGNPINNGYFYARDWSGNSSTEWAHHAYLTPLFDPATYQDGQFFTYRVALANVVNPDGFLRQFVIALTTGSYNHNEKWTFDWIHVYTTGVDFVDNYALWSDCNNTATTGYSNGDRVISPTGPRPSIVSAGLMPVDSLYTKVGIKFHIENAGSEMLRVYFNIGNGYYAAPFVSGFVDHSSGTEQTVILDIPNSAIGLVKGISVVFFDNDNYQNKTIHVNDMAILVTDEDAYLMPYPVQTVSEYLGN